MEQVRFVHRDVGTLHGGSKLCLIQVIEIRMSQCILGRDPFDWVEFQQFLQIS